MNTAVINIKTDPHIKAQAQKIASQLGLSISGLINGYLRQLIKTKTVHFSLSEEPSEYLINALQEAEADLKAGRVVSFKTSKQTLNYLDKMIQNEEKSNQN